MRTSSLLFAAVARISGTSSLSTAELERLQAWNNEVYDGTVNILVDDGEASKGSSCIWLQGNYGQALICPAYYAAAGVCGSGRRADCNGHYKVKSRHEVFVGNMKKETQMQIFLKWESGVFFFTFAFRTLLL